MVSSGRQTIVCILLLLSTVVSAQSQNAVDKAATSTISGKVTVGGKGVWGVVVGLVISDQYRSNLRATRFRSTTDEDGNYRITNVPPGTYDVIPASPAYVATEGRKSLIVGKNETVENIDIALERGGVFTGKVTDADGRPVIEETIYVSSATTAARLFYVRNVRTDDRGIYRAYGIPAGSYRVSAGRDANSSFDSRRQQGGSQRTYHPSAVDPAEASVIEVREGNEATNVDITLVGPARTYSARGRIINGDTSQPVPNTHVGLKRFFGVGGSSSIETAAESTKDGEFTLENLSPGKYAVYSAPPTDSEWHAEAVRFEVIDQDVEGLLLKTSVGASASGVIILEGTNDPKVRVNLVTGRILAHTASENFGYSTHAASIEPDGTFRITGLTAGRLTLQFQTSGQFRLMRIERDGVAYQRGLEIKEREQVTGLRVIVGHANGAIRGVIKLPTRLDLPTTARLRVAVRRTEDLPPGSYGSPVEADARGHFRVEGLIPGTYEITVRVFVNAPPAQQPRIPPTRQTVVVTKGAVADVTITLQMPRPALSGP